MQTKPHLAVSQWRGSLSARRRLPDCGFVWRQRRSFGRFHQVHDACLGDDADLQRSSESLNEDEGLVLAGPLRRSVGPWGLL